MIVLVKIQIAREIFVKFLYVQYLFSNVVSDHEGTERGEGGEGGGREGQHEEKMCEVNFYGGRKKWGNIQQNGRFLKCCAKGKRGASRCPFPFRGKFCAN